MSTETAVRPRSTYAAQLAEAKRELALRHRVYPRMVREDTMTEAQAFQRLALQEDIIATLAGLAAQEAGQGELFH